MKLSRQAFTMSTLTMLLQVSGKMLYLPILVPTFWCEIWWKNIKNGVERCKGNTPEIGIVTAGEEILSNWMWFVEMEVREREAPLWNILTNRRICVFVPPFVIYIILFAIYGLITTLFNRMRNLHSI